jgi:hypothetical protein
VLEYGECKEGVIWRADPKIEPSGLDISGTNREPPAGGGFGFSKEGERGIQGLGGLKHGI